MNNIIRPHLDVRFSVNHILIRDISGLVYVFDKDGNYLNYIGEIGRGPGEFKNSNGFIEIQKDGKAVVVILPFERNQLYFYTFDNQFLGSKRLDNYAMELTSMQNSPVLINTLGTRHESNYYALNIVSNEGKLIKRELHLPKERKFSKDIMVNGILNYYKHKDTLYYWEQGYETVYQIVPNSFGVIPKFDLIVGEENTKWPIADHTREKMMSQDTRYFRDYNHIDNFQETSTYGFLKISRKGRLHHVLYNKSTTESVSVQYQDPIKRTQTHFAFRNDIDGGMPFWPMGKVDDNTMFMLIDGFELKEYLEKHSDSTETILDPDARERLIKQAEATSMEDNPILMMVTFKS